MPKVNLTNRKLQSLKPLSQRIDYFDSTLPGFCVRVTPRGVKTFAVMYRHAGKLRRYTIGKHPRISLVDARNEAREALRKAALGNDTATEKHQERQTGTFWRARRGIHRSLGQEEQTILGRRPATSGSVPAAAVRNRSSLRTLTKRSAGSAGDDRGNNSDSSEPHPLPGECNLRLGDLRGLSGTQPLRRLEQTVERKSTGSRSYRG